jgi:hypothetical protein
MSGWAWGLFFALLVALVATMVAAFDGDPVTAVFGGVAVMATACAFAYERARPR